MTDKYYTEVEAFALNRAQQEAVLDLRGVNHNSQMNERAIVNLILESNPEGVTIFFTSNDCTYLRHVLEIAEKGVPGKEIINFINSLRRQI